MADQAEAPAGERELTRLIAARIRDVPDYPQPGVVFKDITPLLADGAAFRAVIDVLAGTYGPVDKVAGIEARGFILAAPVAARLGAGFVPIRKKGKLPGVTFAQDYQLEYGTATIEVLADAFDPDDRVLVSTTSWPPAVRPAPRPIWCSVRAPGWRVSPCCLSWPSCTAGPSSPTSRSPRCSLSRPVSHPRFPLRCSASRWPRPPG